MARLSRRNKQPEVKIEEPKVTIAEEPKTENVEMKSEVVINEVQKISKPQTLNDFLF